MYALCGLLLSKFYKLVTSALLLVVGQLQDKEKTSMSYHVYESGSRDVRDTKLPPKQMEMVWFIIVSYDSANKQKHHKSHRMQ